MSYSIKTIIKYMSIIINLNEIEICFIILGKVLTLVKPILLANIEIEGIKVGMSDLKKQVSKDSS